MYPCCCCVCSCGVSLYLKPVSKHEAWCKRLSCNRIFVPFAGLVLLKSVDIQAPPAHKLSINGYNPQGNNTPAPLDLPYWAVNAAVGLGACQWIAARVFVTKKIISFHCICEKTIIIHVRVLRLWCSSFNFVSKCVFASQD